MNNIADPGPPRDPRPKEVKTVSSCTSPWTAPPHLHADTRYDVFLDWWRQHRLPPPLEVVLSWTVAAACLGYYGLSYIATGTRGWISAGWKVLVGRAATTTAPTNEPRYIPLTSTRVRSEKLSSTLFSTRREELARDIWQGIRKQEKKSTLPEEAVLQDQVETLIQTIRQGPASLRHQMSLFMALEAQEIPILPTPSLTSNSGAWLLEEDHVPTAEQLFHMLDAIWPRLLTLPSVEDATVGRENLHNDDDDDDDDDDDHPLTAGWEFDITMIIPCYREIAAKVVQALAHNYQACQHPHRVQVVLVDAGQCPALAEEMQAWSEAANATPRGGWGQLRWLKAEASAGRGPAINAGLALARGRLLTVVHADTVLPPHWDARVQETLLPQPATTTPTKWFFRGLFTGNDHHRRVQACAFSFGHRTRPDELDGLSYPWGILAIRFLGNFRASWFKLPYGDHVITIPTAYLRYLGGYPSQPMMEDYDLMDLLRQRARLRPEKLVIIPRPAARCGVRRWQKFGVVYVTLVNALMVHRYAHGGWTAQDVFDYYYVRPFCRKQE